MQAIIRVAISQSPASYSEVLQPALKSWRVLSSGFFFGINMENKGYVLVWRKMLDSGLMQMPNTLTLFMYILVNATHKDIKSGMVELKRGQYISGRKKLAKELKQSEQNIRTSLKKLEELKILTIKTTSEYSVYTIEKYDYYQNPENKVTKVLTNDQPTANQRLTTKQTHNTQNTHNTFDLFWSEYPNKSGKVQAKKAWDKHKPDLDVIKSALSWQKESDGWKRGFVPMASTYINNARWDDENPNGSFNDMFAGAI